MEIFGSEKFTIEKKCENFELQISEESKIFSMENFPNQKKINEKKMKFYFFHKNQKYIH